MSTIDKIKDLLIAFYRDYFWGTIKGACITTGFAAAFVLIDKITNVEGQLENVPVKDLSYSLLNAIHTGMTIYWEYMGVVDIIVLVLTGVMLIFRGATRGRRYY